MRARPDNFRHKLLKQRLSISQRSVALAVTPNQSPHGRGRIKMRALDGPGQTDKLQDANAPPVEIDLVPLQSMTSGGRVGVMIVMPALAKSKDRDPPTVTGIFSGFEPSSSPKVCGGIYQPGRVQADNQAQENTPQHDAKPAKYPQADTHHDQRHPVKAVEQDIEGLAQQVGSVMLERGFIVVLRLSENDPANVRPPTAVTRRMRIALLIGMSMMNPMGGGPLNRPALQGECAAEHEKVFNWLWDLVTAMSDQSVKAHPNTQTAGDPIQNRPANDCRPAPEEDRDHRSDVRNDEEYPTSPFDVSFLHRGRQPSFIPCFHFQIVAQLATAQILFLFYKARGLSPTRLCGAARNLSSSVAISVIFFNSVR